MIMKEKYEKLAMQVFEVEMEQDLLAYSVTSTGLGDDDKISRDNIPGDSWSDAMSRCGAWNDEE